MIDYSIAIRSAQPGTLAEKVTQKKAYATIQYEVMTLDQLAEHIASHNSKYDEADILAVTTLLGRCVREQLLEGRKVSLGQLGSFYPGIVSKGADIAAEFTVENIKKVPVRWSPSARLKDLRKDAEFNLVPTRVFQNDAKNKTKSQSTAVEGSGSGDADIE